MKFEIFQEQTNQNKLSLYGAVQQDYRWRLRANNGEPIASSGEGYRKKSDCQHAIDLVKGTSAVTPVIDLTVPANGLIAAALGLRRT